MTSTHPPRTTLLSLTQSSKAYPPMDLRWRPKLTFSSDLQEQKARASICSTESGMSISTRSEVWKASGPMDVMLPSNDTRVKSS